MKYIYDLVLLLCVMVMKLLTYNSSNIDNSFLFNFFFKLLYDNSGITYINLRELRYIYIYIYIMIS